MKQTKITVESEYDGLRLGVLMIEPDQEPIAIIQLTHGISEHKERYIHIMEYMCGKGFACIIHDHRGHGESVKDESDIGYTYKKGWNGIVDDLYQITEYSKAKWPQKHVIILAHSMGTLATRVYLKKHDDEVIGVILCGAPSNVKSSKFGLFLLNLMSIFKRTDYKSEYFNEILMNSISKHSVDNSSELSWLSVSKKNIEEYEKDEKCGFIFSLNGYKTILKLLCQTYSRRGWNMRNEDLPLFFIAGSDDPWIRGKKHFLQSIRFIKEVGYENVSYRLYSGYRHEIMNEDIYEFILDDILEKINIWLEEAPEITEEDKALNNIVFQLRSEQSKTENDAKREEDKKTKVFMDPNTINSAEQEEKAEMDERIETAENKINTVAEAFSEAADVNQKR